MVMVNLDKGLYKKISDTVQTNTFEYPTITNFVERSVLKELERLEEQQNYRYWMDTIMVLYSKGKLDKIRKMYQTRYENDLKFTPPSSMTFYELLSPWLEQQILKRLPPPIDKKTVTQLAKLRGKERRKAFGEGIFLKGAAKLKT